MFDKILFPTDGSEISDKTLSHAIEYCSRLGAEMTVLYVMPFSSGVNAAFFGDYVEKVREQNELYGKELLERAAERAQARGVQCKTLLVANDQPHRAIIDAARDLGCGMIFMASHGRRGFGEVLLGSETQKVLAYSKIPVLVFR